MVIRCQCGHKANNLSNLNLTNPFILYCTELNRLEWKQLIQSCWVTQVVSAIYGRGLLADVLSQATSRCERERDVSYYVVVKCICLLLLTLLSCQCICLLGALILTCLLEKVKGQFCRFRSVGQTSTSISANS